MEQNKNEEQTFESKKQDVQIKEKPSPGVSESREERKEKARDSGRDQRAKEGECFEVKFQLKFCFSFSRTHSRARAKACLTGLQAFKIKPKMSRGCWGSKRPNIKLLKLKSSLHLSNLMGYPRLGPITSLVLLDIFLPKCTNF